MQRSAGIGSAVSLLLALFLPHSAGAQSYEGARLLSLAEAQRALQADKRFTVDAHREAEFYAQQSQLLGRILSFLAVMITGIMAVGAVFGAINTMYAAIASRAPEIGVLLTLGFKPGSVLLSFLAESAFIALIGGVLGCLFALPLNGIVTSTTNWLDS